MGPLVEFQKTSPSVEKKTKSAPFDPIKTFLVIKRTFFLVMRGIRTRGLLVTTEVC